MNVKYQQYFLGLTMLTSDNHVVYWHITKRSLVEVYMFQHFSSIEEIGTVWYSYLDQHAGMQLPSTEGLNHRKAACQPKKHTHERLKQGSSLHFCKSRNIKMN